jgi:hypothetical protein
MPFDGVLEAWRVDRHGSGAGPRLFRRRTPSLRDPETGVHTEVDRIADASRPAAQERRGYG